jgi:hypothetical protein
MKVGHILPGVALVVSLLFPAVPASAQPASGGSVAAADAAEAAFPPAGQVNRYVIPNYSSQTGATSRSFAVVTIHNSGTASCNAGVQFQYAFGTTNVCSITLPIPAGQSRLFCTRPVDGPLTSCSVACPGSGLTFNIGHAYVSSGSTCRIAVDAQQYFTRDAADDLIESQSRLSIVKPTASNLGD